MSEPLKVVGGGPNWTALVRKSDKQVMIAFAGCTEPTFGMVRAFLRAVGSAIPRRELIVVELNAQLLVAHGSSIEERFRRFEATQASAEAAVDWIRKGGRA